MRLLLPPLAVLLTLAPSISMPRLVAPVPGSGMAFQWTTTQLKVEPSAAAGLAIVDVSGNGFSGWTQLVASTADKWTLFAVAIDAPTESNIEVEIGVGAAAAETAVTICTGILPNAASGHMCYFGPLVDRIPAGSRVSVRFRDWYGLNSGLTWRFKVMYYEGTMAGNNTVMTTGFSSHYTVLATCGTSGNYGNWVQWTASTDSDGVYLYGTSHQDDTNSGAAYFMDIQIGTGGAGSETVIASLPRRAGWSSVNTALWTDYQWPMLKVNGSTRLAVRCRSSVNSKRVWARAMFLYDVTDDLTGLYTQLVPKIMPDSLTPTTLGGPAVTSPWSYGAWSEFIASTSTPIAITGFQSADCDTQQFEYGIGAAAAEVTQTTQRMSDRNCSGQTTYTFYPHQPNFKIAGSGHRVSMRQAKPLANATTVRFSYIEDPDYYVVTEMQRNFPDRLDVAISASSSAWADSSWVELVSAANNTTDILLSGINSWMPSQWDGLQYELDIGVGAASSEQVVLTVAGVGRPGQNQFWLKSAHRLASGQRIAIRTRKEGTNTDTFWSSILYFRDDPPGDLTGGAWLRNPVKFCCTPFGALYSLLAQASDRRRGHVVR